jgi:hypothetical protein
VVLLFLGAITFLVLIARLALGKKVQIPLFFVCIICIGYPSIKSFQYRDFTGSSRRRRAQRRRR